MGQSGTAPNNENVLVQVANTESMQVNSGLTQPVENANVCVIHEAPPEQAGGCGVLKPVVGSHVLSQTDIIPSNLCNGSATNPVCSYVSP